MKNEKVFTLKLKLPEKYLTESHIALMLNKPGTLSKKEKQWLRSYVALLELKDLKPSIARDKLSDAFIRSLKKNNVLHLQNNK